MGVFWLRNSSCWKKLGSFDDGFARNVLIFMLITVHHLIPIIAGINF